MPRCQCCGTRECLTHGPVSRRSMAPPAAFDPAPLARAGYRVLRVLGKGGFGTVVAAVHPPDDTELALKIARADLPPAEARLLREAEALVEVGAPHAPAFHGLHRLDDGTPFLVMELLSAPTLATLLGGRSAPLSLNEVRALALAVLEALDAVHARALVHRDLKPEHVFVEASGRVRLVDFGLVKRLGRRDVELTLEGSAVGTPEYISPEQCSGDGDVDARADLYAVGVMLYEMLSGRPPFWGSPVEVLHNHRCRRPPPFGEATPVPEEIDALVRCCLAKDAGERFQTAAELAREIDLVFRAAIITARPPPLLPPDPPLSVPAAPPALTTGERRQVALVFFTAAIEVSRVQEALAPLGGRLAHAGREGFVAAFEHDAGDNPAQRAVAAALSLLAAGLCARARVDVAPVWVRRRDRGEVRYQSAIFAREDSFPDETFPRGVTAGPTLVDLLPDHRWIEVAGRVDVVRLDSAKGASVGRGALHDAPLLGRDEVLGRLVAAAARAIRERAPATARVLGDAGLGKSRLSGALADRIQQELPFVEIIRLRARELASGGPEPLLHELLGPAAEPLDLDRLRAAPGALSAAAAREAGEALRHRAAARPLVVLLDDAHLADVVTLDALEHAARADAQIPLFVVALGRPSFEAARPSWGERAAAREEIRLGPLSPEAAAALCRALLAPVRDVPVRAIERLVGASRAIPLLLVELTRSLRRGGAIRRHARGDAWYLATEELHRLPDLPLVEWLAQRELGALPPDLAAHARLAALLGAEISIAELAGVLSAIERAGGERDLCLDARAGARRLVATGLLVELGPDRVGFRHALVREAVARTIAVAPSARMHRAAFSYYGEPRPDPVADPATDTANAAAADERRLAQRAWHAAEAGLPDAAREAYLALAERERDRHAYLDAGASYTSALGQPGEATPLFRQSCHRGRGLVHYRIGRYDDALADLTRARGLASERGDAAAEIELLLDEATVLDWMESFRASQSCVAQAQERASAVGLSANTSPSIHARLLLGLGRSCHRFNREEEASLLLGQAAAAALGDAGYETRVIALLVLGFILPGLGRLPEAEGVLEQAIAESVAHGDRLHLFAALNNRALAWGYRGDRARTLATFGRALGLAGELGQSTMELVGHYNLAEYLYLTGDVAGAAPHLERAADIEQRLLGAAARPVVALLRARVRLHQGDLDEARAVTAAIRAQQAEAYDRGQSETQMVPAEDVLCSAVELGTRDASEPEWRALTERSRRFSVGQERLEVLELHALSLARRGRPAEARRCLQRALALSRNIPSVLGERLRGELEALGQPFAGAQRAPSLTR